MSKRLDILQWAREEGCPWDQLTYSLAERCRDEDLMEWVKLNGCPRAAPEEKRPLHALLSNVFTHRMHMPYLRGISGKMICTHIP